MVETMKVYGINKETGVQEYIGEAPITYEMKINDIAQSYFGGCFLMTDVCVSLPCMISTTG